MKTVALATLAAVGVAVLAGGAWWRGMQPEHDTAVHFRAVPDGQVAGFGYEFKKANEALVPVSRERAAEALGTMFDPESESALAVVTSTRTGERACVCWLFASPWAVAPQGVFDLQRVAHPWTIQMVDAFTGKYVMGMSTTE
jgi:hypothetical protein